MALNTQHNPYHEVILQGDDAPEPQGTPIPPRQAAQQSTETAQPEVSQIDLHPGMACRTPQGHAVCITQILHADPDDAQEIANWKPQAEVGLLRNPRLTGPVYLSELTPIPVKVQEGDKVLLHVGDLGFPIYARVVQVDGEYAQFFSDRWNEARWGHTSHVLSISPRDVRRQPGAK